MPKKMHAALKKQAKKKGFTTDGELSKRGRAYVFGPLEAHKKRKKKC